MALTIHFQSDSPIPIDASSLSPDKMALISQSEICRIQIAHGNEKLELGEIAKVDGDAGDGQLKLSGSLSNLERIGQGMRTGAILLDGDAGNHVGNRMDGGTITITGNAGHFLGAEMSGGRIEVAKNAGDDLGSHYPGSTSGMNRGVILVSGNAGERTGQMMRRGTIAVGGSTLNDCGKEMKAGTILIGERCGLRTGLGMKRGTLILGPGNVPNDRSFVQAGHHSPTFTRILARWVTRISADPLGEKMTELLRGKFDVFAGDRLKGGRGEVMIAPNR